MRKWLVSLFLLGLTLCAYSTWFEYYPSNAFISRSPENPYKVVDCVKTGFNEISIDFRIHDLRASPLKPITIGDLFLQGSYYPGHIFWSRDGTVAAASVISESEQQEWMAVAYDFTNHRSIVSSPRGAALDHSKDMEIRQLLQARGGTNRTTEIPSFKEM
jgi:hypothetical protein